MNPEWVPDIYQITSVKKLNNSVVSLDMKPSRGELPNYQPGQFNMLYAFGIGEIPISISGANSSHFQHTVRAVGKVSEALCLLKEGMTVGLRGPFGHGWPMEKIKDKHLIIMAGGLGHVPLRPVLQKLSASKATQVDVLIGARSPEQILFKNELDALSQNNIRVHQIVDQGSRSWHGHVGAITKLVSHIRFDKKNVLAMICGPEIMMRFCANELKAKGVLSSDIFVSLERNMKCAIGFCGHCQLGPEFICKDGPVFSYDQVEDLMRIRQL